MGKRFKVTDKIGYDRFVSGTIEGKSWNPDRKAPPETQKQHIQKKVMAAKAAKAERDRPKSAVDTMAETIAWSRRVNAAAKKYK